MVMNTKNDERINAPKMIAHEDTSDFLEILLDEPLVAGEDYSLFLAFKGEMSIGLDALYVSTYHEGNPAYEGDTSTERQVKKN